jgi:hypothetical protein
MGFAFCRYRVRSKFRAPSPPPSRRPPVFERVTCPTNALPNPLIGFPLLVLIDTDGRKVQTTVGAMMNRNRQVVPPFQEFAVRLERALEPAFSECFSPETRKTKNILLITSLLLILLILRVVQPTLEPIEIPIIKIGVTVNSGLRWVLVVLCGYFEVLLWTRSYVEWKWWRLRQQAPGQDIFSLNSAIAAASRNTLADLVAKNQRSLELIRQIAELGKDPPEMDELRAKQATLHERQTLIYKETSLLHKEYSELTPEDMDTPRERLLRSKLDALYLSGEEIFDQWIALEDEISRKQTAHDAFVASAGEPLRKQLDQLGETGFDSPESQNLEDLRERADYLLSNVQAFKWTQIARFLIEMIFPLLVGIIAISWGTIIGISEILQRL